jgi:hypothetical protein
LGNIVVSKADMGGKCEKRRKKKRKKKNGDREGGG